MDSRLGERLQKIAAQIDVLYKAEEDYLTLEAAKEHKLAVIVTASPGTSQAAKDAAAKATTEWLQFRKDLALAEAVFHRERHILELKNNAFQAEYLSFKIEQDAIRKQGIG